MARLHAVATGSGPPDFVCLHGLLDTHEIWDSLAEPLARRGRVVRVDHRGHGRSPAPPGPYSREDLAGDVIEVLDRYGIERAVLVAHSMGGVVAMATALAYPERVSGLALIGTTGRCSEKVAGWYERLASTAEREGTAGIGRAVFGKDDGRKVEGDAQGIAHVTRVLKSLHADPLAPKLGELRCPTVLLVGEKDPMGLRASELLVENLVDAHLEVVPDCGHWVHVEEPDVCLRALEGFAAAG